MRQSKRRIHSINNVGKMYKSGGVRVNITAKRLTIPVGFLNFQTDQNCVQTEFEHSCGGWKNSFKLQQIRFKSDNNCNKSKSVFREIERKYIENFRKLPQFPIEIQQQQQQQQQQQNEFTKTLKQQLINKTTLKNFNYYKKQINNEIVKIDTKLLRYQKIDKSLKIKKMASTSATTTTSTSNNKNRKRQICDNNDNNLIDNNNNKENIPMKFPFIPSTNWVYQTPPNRKLNFNNLLKQQQQQDLLNDGIIQPAVVHTCNDKTIVYEMNKRINIDLTNYQNKQEIDIDRRYMVEVTNIQQQQQQHQQQYIFRFNGNNGDNVDQMEVPASDPYELEQHFLSLSCRPKKSLSTVSRIQNIKRKRDMFLSSSTTTSSSTSTSTSIKQTKFQENFLLNNNNNNNDNNNNNNNDNDVMEFESSFSVINPNPDCIEESFTFKFTPTGKRGSSSSNSSSNSATVAGRLFDNEGNEKDSFTFQCDME